MVVWDIILYRIYLLFFIWDPYGQNPLSKANHLFEIRYQFIALLVTRRLTDQIENNH